MHKMFNINDITGYNQEVTEHAGQFLPYAHEKLGFNKPVGVNFISDPENAKDPLGKTAYYDPNKMEITIFVDKRHVKDILRSLSHELVHHTQNCRGEFAHGTETGEGYAQKDPHMRKMEAEAYLLGNGFLFRDWEDQLKQKKGNITMSNLSETKLREYISDIIKDVLSEGDPVKKAVSNLPGKLQKTVHKAKARKAVKDHPVTKAVANLEEGDEEKKAVSGLAAKLGKTVAKGKKKEKKPETAGDPVKSAVKGLPGKLQKTVSKAKGRKAAREHPVTKAIASMKEEEGIKVKPRTQAEKEKEKKVQKSVKKKTVVGSPAWKAAQDVASKAEKSVSKGLEEENLEEVVVDPMDPGTPPEEGRDPDTGKCKDGYVEQTDDMTGKTICSPQTVKFEENWKKGNKSQLLFDRLVKKWAK